MRKTTTILALLAAHTAYAGNGGLEGAVVDQQTNKLALGVTIDITCGKVHRSTRVDGAGHFVLRDLPEGACTLTTGGAYARTDVGVTITSDSIATVVINVTSKAYAEQLAKQQAAQQALYNKRMKELKKPGAVGRGGGMGMGKADFDVDGRFAGAVAEAPAPMAAPPPAPPHPHPPLAAGGGKKPTATATGRAAATTPAAPAPVVAAKDVAAKAAIVAKPPVMPKQPVRLEEEHRQMDKKKIAAHGPMRVDALHQVNGWALVRVFPVPQYGKAYDGPRNDFRETIYWNGGVETDGHGDAEVSFVASDAVTAFRATAEGFSATGAPGGGQATFQSKLPLNVDAKLPVEVTSGDAIRLPVTLANETSEGIDATLSAKFGAAFKLAENPAGTIHLDAKQKRTVFFPLEVVATDGESDVEIKVTAKGLADEVAKKIRVVPRGFPIELSASGTAKKGAQAAHVLDLAGALPGSIHAKVTMYPSPVAAMTQGMEGMIREPGGCFEQASSSNYPNVMILAYLGANDAADPKLVQKTRTTLDKGYKLLTGYETPEKGYEWFGHTPGHEALTAYGLMEFADMAKVYDVDPKMVERTSAWLMNRRDHKGGFMRSSQAVDSFGRANEQTTNAYIMWALAEAKRTGSLDAELAAQKTLGSQTQDPYLLALAANTNLIAAPKAGETASMIKRLAGMQAKDGSFSGAKESITMSGGESLAIETTSLAVLALIKASPKQEYEAQIRAGVDWLNGKRGGYGSWGNTQATILGLKALGAYSEHARSMASGGKATLVINGKDAGTIAFEKGRRDALVWDDFASKLAPGKNTIEIRIDGSAALPYSIAIDYRSTSPASSPKTKVAVTTQLLKTKTKMGEAVTLRAHVENTTNGGIPMTLARIGLPGGTVFQTWQLKELRDKGLIDFYETRPREVILYWRALPPSAKKDIDINLLSTVPGTYDAPASSAYLYYTAEDKAWAKPVSIAIDSGGTALAK